MKQTLPPSPIFRSSHVAGYVWAAFDFLFQTTWIAPRTRRIATWLTENDSSQQFWLPYLISKDPVSRADRALIERPGGAGGKSCRFQWQLRARRKSEPYNLWVFLSHMQCRRLLWVVLWNPQPTKCFAETEKHSPVWKPKTLANNALVLCKRKQHIVWATKHSLLEQTHLGGTQETHAFWKETDRLTIWKRKRIHVTQQPPMCWSIFGPPGIAPGAAAHPPGGLWATPLRAEGPPAVSQGSPGPRAGPRRGSLGFRTRGVGQSQENWTRMNELGSAIFSPTALRIPHPVLLSGIHEAIPSVEVIVRWVKNGEQKTS